MPRGGNTLNSPFTNKTGKYNRFAVSESSVLYHNLCKQLEI